MDDAARRLTGAGWVFAFGSAIHLADHLRRGQASITEELYVVGNLALILQVVAITLIATRHVRGPQVAALVGVPLAVGFMGAHWLPEWSALSDPVWQIESARWFSYLASGTEILGAAAIAAAGIGVLRARERVPT